MVYSPLSQTFRPTVIWLWPRQDCPRVVEVAQSNCILVSQQVGPISRTRDFAYARSRNSLNTPPRNRRSLTVGSSPVVCDTSGMGSLSPAALVPVSCTSRSRKHNSNSRGCYIGARQRSLVGHRKEIRAVAIALTVNDNKTCRPGRSHPRGAARRSAVTGDATVPGKMARFDPEDDHTVLSLELNHCVSRTGSNKSSCSMCPDCFQMFDPNWSSVV